MEQRQRIRDYWNLRAEGFSLSNIDQLKTDQKDIWLDLLQRYAPAQEKLKCLDVGCGPGFLAILLAQCGHQVFAVDYTENMLEYAQKNAQAVNVRIRLQRMDAQKLLFEDESFDYIVSRNLTWNLEYPEEAYREWLRVLKPGGRMVNFDGNHCLHHHHDLYREYRESGTYIDPHKKEFVKDVDLHIMDEISKKLPLSRIERPAWDTAFFIGAGVKKIILDIERAVFVAPSDQRKKSVIKSFCICVEK